MFHRERYKQLKFLIIDEISMVITLLALSGALYRTMHHYPFSISLSQMPLCHSSHSKFLQPKHPQRLTLETCEIFDQSDEVTLTWPK